MAMPFQAYQICMHAHTHADTNVRVHAHTHTGSIINSITSRTWSGLQLAEELRVAKYKTRQAHKGMKHLFHWPLHTHTFSLTSFCARIHSHTRTHTHTHQRDWILLPSNVYGGQFSHDDYWFRILEFYAMRSCVEPCMQLRKKKKSKLPAVLWWV